MKIKNISYLVQIGYKNKGAYKTVASARTLGRAQAAYACYNIGNGYKKRLKLVITFVIESYNTMYDPTGPSIKKHTVKKDIILHKYCS